MKKIISSLILTGVVSASNASVTSGGYLGLEVGGANQNINYNASSFNINTNGTALSDSSWTGIGRVFGGYNFSRYNAVEAGLSQSLSNSFNTTASGDKFSTTSTVFDISYLPMLPISNSNINVFGRLGVGYAWLPGGQVGCNCTSDTSFNASGGGFTDVLGAGIRYKFANNWSVKVEWIADGLLFPVGVDGAGSWDQQTFQTGVAFHF